MNLLQDVFISYGRADSRAFVAKLYQRLLAEGLTVWLDLEDIPLGVDYQKQIDDAIDKVDNFLFIISPHAVNSPYCLLEIERALQHNKRIIPLLHVEEIGQDIWQQRYPESTAADWEAYQAAGKQSSFPNMHPDISRINWVNFRETVDDFEQSFQALLAIFERQKDYVHQHTIFLNDALRWEKNQKQPEYLLMGEKHQQAQDFLVKRFQEEQAPCIPTDLHCEYITESTKNANNLMTQVFLCHAEQDRDITRQIRRSLMRSGITTWSYQNDITIGTDFQDTIKQGIEETDNILFLMSPDGIESEYCQQELDYAFELNKRIIPIRAGEVDPSQIPARLRNLQYIDLADNLTDADYSQDESKLLQVLRKGTAYYTEHKVLLAKALKWQRQHSNPSMLLRGYNLRQAETWLKTAVHYGQNPPTAFHLEFIEESLRTPPAASLDVFISYSRAEAGFARKLNEALQIQGKTTWFDQESITVGSADFQAEIHRGIALSDHFLFVLSPRSVSSTYCADEVEYAVSLNKRFVCLLYAPIEPQNLHPQLAKVQWIEFDPLKQDFDSSFRQLVRVLETDPDHVRHHTKWLQRALEWLYRDRSPDLLLRESEFAIAENWLQETDRYKKNPKATPLIHDYITVSRETIAAAMRRERFNIRLIRGLLGLVSIAFLCALFLGIRIFQQKQLVERSLEAQTLALSDSSRILTESDNDFDALLTAMRAAQPVLSNRVQLAPDLHRQVEAALQMALYNRQERNRLETHQAGIFDVSISPDSKTIATASADRTVKLWDLQGNEIETLTGHQDWVYGVSFSPNGQTLATAGKDGTAKLWSLNGALLKTLTGHTAPVRSVSFSADGQQLATASFDDTVRLWTVAGDAIATLVGHQDEVWTVQFSPDGRTLASASLDRTIKLWNRDGTFLKTLANNSSQIFSLGFSPDGQMLATADADNMVKLWSLDGKLRQTLTGHNRKVWGVNFSADGLMLVTVSGDRTAKLWRRRDLTAPFVEQTTLTGHLNQVYSASFSPDGDYLVTVSQDDTAKLWQLGSRRRLEGHQGRVQGVSFSPDGQTIATASTDQTAKLWQRNGKELLTLTGHQDWVYRAEFSPDGQTIATASKDQTVKLWTLEGQEMATFTGHQGAVYDLAFSPDGQTIATVSEDKTAKLWSLTGQATATLTGHQQAVYAVEFSPDGQTIATTGEDSTVRLWSLGGQEKVQFSRPGTLFYDLAFSPNGQSLLTASHDTLIRQWTLQGDMIQVFSGHRSQAASATFSPDGDTLASTSIDQTAKLWTLEGQELLTIEGHQGAVLDATFSPDGTALATAGNDRVVMLWEISPLPKLMEQGCTWLFDYLQTNPNVSAEDKMLCPNTLDYK
ncbi:TIR domain-containing protein [Leptothoe sp. PORK10 BA2]|uniref:TIR domain-containing protein n=1 Tax=Leptothoe sp. PORK10 BA2 TaxID=3110254 RepID=UPI002B1EAAA7|nr:TIR domain-containing protein [Leptothoe sp. PORK10 BA2]MEA5466854.1 TIR domain-containing protein [Leptothoe sp. PORK10 BA2]